MHLMKALKSDKCIVALVSLLGCLTIVYINSLLFPFQNNTHNSNVDIKQMQGTNIPSTVMKYHPQTALVRDPVPMGKQLIFNKNCLFIRLKGERPIAIPPKNEVDKFGLHDMGCLLNRYVSSLQTLCERLIFMGKISHGGVEYCADLKPQPSGNVFFYENDKDDFHQLLLDLVSRFKTNVTYLYKTSQLKVNIGSTKGVLTQIRETKNVDIFESIKDGKTNILPIALQHDESALKSLSKSLRVNSLKSIQVIILKLHYKAADYTKEGLRQWFEVLRIIHKKDFRIYWFDRSYHCASKNPKFNDCWTVCFVKRDKSTSKLSKPFTLPEKSAILKMTKKSAMDNYHTFLSIIQYHCKEFVRIGHTKDGGWDVCIDPKYAPGKSCLVYSFGIEFDWTFEEGVSETFGCEVYAFDPSLDMRPHLYSRGVHFQNIGIYSKDTRMQGDVRSSRNGGARKSTWQIRTLKSILKENGHLNRQIDILKMDVERAEWASIPNMISTGVLKNVKQLFVEFHGEGNQNELLVIRQLHDQGFRVFWFHRNPGCTRYSNNVPICICLEMYFVNTQI